MTGRIRFLWAGLFATAAAAAIAAPAVFAGISRPRSTEELTMGRLRLL